MFFSSGQFQDKKKGVVSLKKEMTIKKFRNNKFVVIKYYKKGGISLKIKARIKGQTIEFEAEQRNFADDFGDSRLTNSLVNTPKMGENRFLFDLRADNSYMTYAGLHECVCCGSYKELAPKVSDISDKCGAIDLMIIEEMPFEYRKTYVLKRIEMFQTLLDKRLYKTQELKKQFEHALEIMKKELEKLD